MTMRDYILEIGTEEIPAAFASWAVDEVLRIAGEEFRAARLTCDSMKSYATPRRIALYVRGLAEKQEDLTEELKGPTWQQAFDANDHPTKAAKGFAKSKNVSVDDLEKRNIGGTDFAVAVLRKEGEPTASVLGEIAPAVIRRLVFPKNMYWDDTFVRFARPIRWILSLFGSEIVPFTYGNIQAGRVTRGHRFMGSRAVEVENAEEYFGKLFDNFVIIDPGKRREKMIAGISSIEKEIAAKAQLDSDLVEENLYLVEFPVPFAGKFDESFLEMPEEVLTTTMKHHQRYFPVRDEKSGALKPYFIGVSNNRAANMAVVREGNERVLKARLSDAAFFWKEDLQVPLHNRVEKLKNIVHQEQLGSVYDRTINIQTIAVALCDQNGWADIRSLAERAAYLSKADLATAMVYEFPELRGVMGREYARRNGEDERVALALYEQYLPAAAGDATPSDLVGAVLGVADRLDTIAGGFKAGLQPTGSQDPYGIRRAARTINEIIWATGMDLDLEEAARTAAGVYQIDKTGVEEMLDFLKQRLHHQAREKGYPHDLTSLALSVTWRRPLQVLKFLESFAAVREDEWFKGLVTASVRVRNILAKSEKVPQIPDESLFVEDAEKSLWQAVLEIREPVEGAVRNCDWEELTRLLARLEPHVTAFFDDVLVMTDDEKLRQNRLALLQETEKLFVSVGDLGLLKR